jgi:hypothetical protein
MRTADEKGLGRHHAHRLTGATSAVEQKAATAQDYPMFSQPITTDQVSAPS